jgi:phosphoribosylformimino-5-aminoimidazole carboxamide ribotide isomerase
VKEEKIAVSGWFETTDIIVYDFIAKYSEKGLNRVFCTDISKDGMAGPALICTRKSSALPDLFFVASEV